MYFYHLQCVQCLLPSDHSPCENFWQWSISPDLNPLSFYLWGYSWFMQQTFIMQRCFINVMESYTIIWHYVRVFERVCQLLFQRVHACVEASRRHLEHFLGVAALRYNDGLLGICLYRHFTLFWCQEPVPKFVKLLGWQLSSCLFLKILESIVFLNFGIYFFENSILESFCNFFFFLVNWS